MKYKPFKIVMNTIIFVFATNHTILLGNSSSRNAYLVLILLISAYFVRWMTKTNVGEVEDSIYLCKLSL